MKFGIWLYLGRSGKIRYNLQICTTEFNRHLRIENHEISFENREY